MDSDPSGGAHRYLDAEDYVELKSNHRGTYTTHGKWVKPVFPSIYKLSRFTINTIYF